MAVYSVAFALVVVIDSDPVVCSWDYSNNRTMKMVPFVVNLFLSTGFLSLALAQYLDFLSAYFLSA